MRWIWLSALLGVLAGSPAWAQTVLLSPWPKVHFEDNNGAPCAGCKLFTYTAGTTTKTPSYTDSTGGTPNTNPVILDARGEANVWLPQGFFKFTLSPSTDSDPPTNAFWTVDEIPSGISEVTGNLHIDGNIGVVGVATIGTLNVTGVGSVAGDFAISGDLGVTGVVTAGSLDVIGSGSFGGGVGVGGDLAVSGNFGLTGVSTFVGAITAEASITPTGGIAAAGGLAISPRNVNTCGGAGRDAAGALTDQTPVATEVYISEVYIPANMTVTGIAVFNGSAVSGNMKVGIANSAGVNVATSASTAAAGTQTYQLVPFTAPYAAVGPATYYVETFYDNTTQRANALKMASCGAAVQTGQTFTTGFTTITPPTTFTANVGPAASLY